MKKFSILIAIVLALGLAFTCQAQFKASSVALGAGTNMAANVHYEPAAALLDVRMYETVAVDCRVVLASAGTANLMFTLAPGLSTTEIDTNNGAYTLSFPATGTVTNYAVTNINVGGYAYLKVLSVTNKNAAAASAIRLRVGQKTYLYNSSKP